ncbi:LysR family transcriptional regulator [Lutimaribacter marinistellae]|uniref:LysR family transcriptional regulator n=1 Tax=Lutimaribacter marinistellae TaxID=1820329 RepID=A0ABV7TBE0_9RHOB
MAVLRDLPDWSLVQSFLDVAETGSLSAAARRTNRSQPTLGRQIQALEDALGIAVFERHARGLRLSDAGREILPMAQRMRDAVQELTLSAAGRSDQLEGTVRITASVFASHHVLPPILARIRQTEPLIQLELAPTDSSDNLLYREADIAVRMYPPRQADILAQHVRDLKLGTFAAKSYLDRSGRPETVADLLRHDIVGFDQSGLIIDTMHRMGYEANRESFPVRCDNQTTYWELVRAGCGIGFCQCSVARKDPLVEELPLGLPIPPLPVWLAAPQAMRRTPRMRRVWDLLAEGLKEMDA